MKARGKAPLHLGRGREKDVHAAFPERSIPLLIPILMLITLPTSLLLSEKPLAQEIIEPHSGQVRLLETDLSVRAGAITLDFQRSLQQQEKTPGLLGSGWRANWEARLLQSGQDMVATDPTGIVRFTAEPGKQKFKGPRGETLHMDPDGQAVRLGADGTRVLYDADGLLKQVTYPGGNHIRLSYESDARLKRLDGPRGSWISLSHDDGGRVMRVEGSNGAVIRYGYTDGRLTEVQVTGRYPVRFAYDAKGLLNRIEDPLTGPVELSYDSRGRVLKRRWADGNEEIYEYDDATVSVRHINAAGGITTMRRSEDRKREEITDPLGNKTVVEYNAALQPTTITGPTGLTSKMGYDALERLTSVEGCCGQSAQIEYLGDSSLPRTVTMSDGTRQTFEYDADQNLLTVMKGQEMQAAFTHYPDGLLKTIKGIRYPERSFTHYPNGLLKTVTDAMEQTTTYEYDLRGNMIQEKDPRGAVSRFEYDAQDRLVAVTDAGNGITRYEFDKKGHCTRLTDPMGSVTEYTYDVRGRTIARKDPLGRTTSFKYAADGQVECITDALGATRRFEYDTMGRLIRSVNPLGGVVKNAYDALGRLTHETDPTGKTWQYAYNPDGSMARVIDPGGHTTEVQYDPKTRRRKVVDENGKAGIYQYDGDGNIVQELLPGRMPRTFSYDKLGNLAGITDSSGSINFSYDLLARLIREVLPTGLEIQHEYDAGGNRVRREDSLGARETMRYDAQGSLTELRNSLGGITRYVYDLRGRLIEEVDPTGQAWRRTYNTAGELVEVRGPGGDGILFDYDQAGRIAGIHHPGGGLTQYSYDPAGNLTEIKEQGEAGIQRTYDLAHRLTSETDALGRITTYTYDAMGRLARKQFADQTFIAYTYDPGGNLAAIDDGIFPVRYSYDGQGRLARLAYPAIKRALTYEYDSQGRRKRLVDSEGRKIDYHYDQYGRIATIEAGDAGQFGFAYDAKDRLISLTYPNGVKGAWEYDTESEPIKIRYSDKNGKVLMGWKYAYDLQGRLISTVDSMGKETRYRYEVNGQLIEEDSPEGKTSYGYMPGGNRAKKETGNKTMEYHYNQADQLLNSSEETFRYDSSGNLIERKGSEGITRYTYDVQGRLAKVALPEGNEVTFGYAPTGERLWRRDKTGLTWFVNDGLNLLAELDESLRPKAGYLHGPGFDRPLVMWHDKKAFYYHLDRLGSVAGMSGKEGVPVFRYETDAFGNLESSEGDSPNPFIFTARYHEPALDLYHYRARYYDARHGRFLSRDRTSWRDPNPTSFNAYVYVLNDPLNLIDPTGLDYEYDPAWKHQYPDEPPPAESYAKPPKVKWTPSGKWKIQYEEIGRFSPKKGPQVNVHIPPGWDPKTVVESATTHEQGHWTQWELWKQRAGLKFDRGTFGTISSAEQKAFHNWVKSVQPSGEPTLRLLERGASWQEAHQDIRNGVNIDDPVVKNAIKAYERYGGDPAKLRASLERYTRGPSGAGSGGGGSTAPSGSSKPQGGFLSGPPGRVTEFMQQHGGKVTVVLTAATLANCLQLGGSLQDCILQAVPGLAIGTIIVVVGSPVLATGATVVGAIAGVKSVYELTKEGLKQVEDYKDRVEAEERKKRQARVNIEQLDEWINKEKQAVETQLGGMAARVDAACETLKGIAARAAQHGNEAKQALGSMPGADLVGRMQKTAAACQKAGEKRAKLDALKQRIEGYARQVTGALEKLSGWAQSCDSKAVAGRIRDGYANCAGLTRGINQLAAQARGIAQELAQVQADVAGTKAIVSAAQSVKDRIVDLAGKAVSESTAFEGALSEATEVKASLEAQCASFLQRIDHLRSTFQSQVDAPLERSQEARFDALRSLVHPFTKRGCSTEGYQSQYRSGSSGAVDARLEAENRLRSLEALAETLADCEGITGDDLIGAIDGAEGEAAAGLLANSDLPGKAADCEQRAEPTKKSKGEKKEGTGEKKRPRTRAGEEEDKSEDDKGSVKDRRRPDTRGEKEEERSSDEGKSDSDLADRYRQRQVDRDKEVSRRRDDQQPYPDRARGDGRRPREPRPHGLTPEDIWEGHTGHGWSGHGSGRGTSGGGKPGKGGTSTTPGCRANSDCRADQYCNPRTGKCITCPPGQHGKKDGTPACCSD